MHTYAYIVYDVQYIFIHNNSFFLSHQNVKLKIHAINLIINNIFSVSMIGKTANF